MLTDDHVVDRLRVADELETAGRPLDAIALLTRANDAAASVAFEARLVELRARAMATGSTSALEHWPRHATDPFPGLAGSVPEIDRDTLSAPLIAGAVEHHGALIVRGLLDEAAVADLRDAVSRSFDARDATKAKQQVEGDEAWFLPFEEGTRHNRFPSNRFVRIIDSPRSLYLLLRCYEDVGLIDLITEHLGERPALSAHKCALRRLRAEPGERSSDYHQDGAFLGEGIRTVNVWLALSDCGGQVPAPGIDLAPCRVDRILETGVDGAMMDWTISESVVARAIEPIEVERPVFRPGDAMMFDELMVHRTAFDRHMTEERIAIESWFFAPSVYPADHVPLMT